MLSLIWGHLADVLVFATFDVDLFFIQLPKKVNNWSFILSVCQLYVYRLPRVIIKEFTKLYSYIWRHMTCCFWSQTWLCFITLYISTFSVIIKVFFLICQVGNSDWQIQFYCETKRIKNKSSVVIFSIDFKSKISTTLEQLFMYPHLFMLYLSTWQIHCDMHTPVWLLQEDNK